jgi:addiction module HigA family antidote
MMEERIYPPMHPGRVLELEFLEPLEITPYALAKAIDVDPPRVYEIVRGRRSVTADTALRLARYFGTSPEFWLNLQSHYDLEVEEGRAAESVAKIQPLAHA